MTKQHLRDSPLSLTSELLQVLSRRRGPVAGPEDLDVDVASFLGDGYVGQRDRKAETACLSDANVLVISTSGPKSAFSILDVDQRRPLTAHSTPIKP